MQNNEGPDEAHRKELRSKVTELMRLCGEIIGNMGAGSWVPGQKLTPDGREEQLSPQAKGLFCEFGVSRERADEIDETEGPNFEKWLKDTETEGLPVPAEYTEIMKLIDSL